MPDMSKHQRTTGFPTDVSLFPWPVTDADTAPNGIYDQNTEDGKIREQQATLFHARKDERPLSSYVEEISGYSWLTYADFLEPELKWRLDELYRQYEVAKGDGSDAAYLGKINGDITAARLVYEPKFGAYTPPVFEPGAPTTVTQGDHPLGR